MPWQRNAPTAKATSEREKTVDGRAGERAAGGCFPDILYSRFRLGIGTAGHDPETGKTIYKNVLSRPPAEAKAKLKAATEETKSLAVIKVERYTADAWMNSSKTMQKSK